MIGIKLLKSSRKADNHVYNMRNCNAGRPTYMYVDLKTNELKGGYISNDQLWWRVFLSEFKR
jgi:hypothetical protein